MQEVDWEKLWNEEHEERKKMECKGSGIEYWDKRAEDFSEFRKANDYEYGRKVLEALHDVLDSNSEVLDIGAGPGTFVIPFARKVKKVTAIEPSKRMVECLRRNAEKAGIENFEIINKKWEDVDLEEIAGKFDLVISSIVVWMFKDIWEHLREMENTPEGYCCVVGSAGKYNEGRFDELWHKIMEEKQWSWSEKNVIYNILFNKGRFANIKIIDYTSQRPVDSWIDFLELFFDRYTEVTPDMRRIIREHAMENAEDGKIRSQGSTTVMWWKAPDRGDE